MNPRKHKICQHCKNYMPETEDVEGECNVDEDITEEAYCEVFEKK